MGHVEEVGVNPFPPSECVTELFARPRRLVPHVAVVLYPNYPVKTACVLPRRFLETSQYLAVILRLLGWLRRVRRKVWVVLACLGEGFRWRVDSVAPGRIDGDGKVHILCRG